MSNLIKMYIKTICYNVMKLLVYNSTYVAMWLISMILFFHYNSLLIHWQVGIIL